MIQHIMVRLSFVSVVVTCPACYTMCPLSTAACEGGWLQCVGHGGDWWSFQWPTSIRSPAAEGACSATPSMLWRHRKGVGCYENSW